MKKYMWPLLLFLLNFDEICGISVTNDSEIAELQQGMCIKMAKRAAKKISLRNSHSFFLCCEKENSVENKARTFKSIYLLFNFLIFLLWVSSSQNPVHK